MSAIKGAKMIYIVLNITAILAATLVSLCFGLLYYRLLDFRKSAGRASTVATAFIAELWLACILAGALILAPPQASLWTMSVGTAVIIWIGFVVPVIAATYQFRGMGWRLTITDCTHWLGVMLIQTVVMRVVGLVPPPV